MKSTQSIDAVRFLTSVNTIRQQRGLTWYAVFRKTGITHISQIVRGQRSLTVASAQTLAQWAGLDLRQYEREEVSA